MSRMAATKATNAYAPSNGQNIVMSKERRVVTKRIAYNIRDQKAKKISNVLTKANQQH